MFKVFLLVAQIALSDELILRGDRFRESGDDTGAIHWYSQALAADSHFAAAYIGRGSALVSIGQYRRAIADLDAAQKLGAENHEVYFQRGRAKRELGRNEEALADLTAAIRNAAYFADAYLERGRAYRDIGERSKALLDFNDAVGLAPWNAAGWLERGKLRRSSEDLGMAIRLQPDNAEAYLERGRIQTTMDSAIRDFEVAVYLRPSDSRLRLELANALAATGRYIEARRHFESAYQIEAWIERSGLYWKSRAIIEYEHGDFSSAIAHFSKAMETEDVAARRAAAYFAVGAYTRAINDLHEPSLLRAKAFLALNEKESALHDLDVIISRAPIAEAYFLRGQMTRSLKDYDAGLAFDPRAIDGLRGRAALHLQTGRYAEAIRDLDEVIAIRPDGEAYRMRGDARLCLGGNALRDYQEAERLGVNDTYIHLIQAQLLRESNPGGALKKFDAALRLDQSNRNARFEKSDLLMKLGRDEDAIIELAALLEFHPADTPALLARGRAFERFGQDERALRDYSAGIVIDPQNPALREARGMLYQKLGLHAEAIKDLREAF